MLILYRKPAYNLAHELFDYILNDDYLVNEFPIAKSNQDIYVNLMIMHLILLNMRMSADKTSYAAKEKTIFQYYCKTNFFVDFAKKLNEDMPVEEFAHSYIENYDNRLKVFTEEIDKVYESLGQRKKDKLYEQEEKKLIKEYLRKYILLYSFPSEHEYCEKITRYFLAHKNYLSSLSHQELISDKIYWGFSRNLMLLESYSTEILIESNANKQT